MKKILFTLLTLLAFSGGVWADDVTPELTISDVYVAKKGLNSDESVSKYGDGCIEISLDTKGIEVRDMQIDIKIPAGFTYIEDKAEIGPAASALHTISWSYPTGNQNYLRIVMMCTAGNILRNGVILRIPIKDNGNHNVGFSVSSEAVDVILTNNLDVNSGSGVGDHKYSSIPYNVIVEDALQLYEAASENMSPFNINNNSNYEYVGNIRVHRTLKPNQWNTIVVPFNMEESEIISSFGSGVELAEFDGTQYTADGANSSLRLKFISVKKSDGMEAHKPYLIKTDGNVVSSFLCNTKSIYYSRKRTDWTWVSDEADSDCFWGNYWSTDIASGNGIYYAYLAGGNFYYLKYGVSTNVQGFRGYFELANLLDYITNVSSSSANLTFFVDDEQITGIDGVATSAPVEGVYDLQGRKVSNDLNTLKSGIYIVNGQKVMVK